MLLTQIFDKNFDMKTISATLKLEPPLVSSCKWKQLVPDGFSDDG